MCDINLLINNNKSLCETTKIVSITSWESCFRLVSCLKACVHFVYIYVCVCMTERVKRLRVWKLVQFYILYFPFHDNQYNCLTSRLGCVFTSWWYPAWSWLIWTSMGSCGFHWIFRFIHTASVQLQVHSFCKSGISA